MVCVANTPVRIMPTIPPTPWLGNTSSVSSTPERVRHSTTSRLITEATTPIINEWLTVTKPAAGVMATKPTTTPIQTPMAVGFLPRAASKKIQASAAAADAALVVANAEAAKPFAPKADPALNPNQPNQSNPVPSITYVIRAGFEPLESLPRLRYSADASAVTPADMCTTVPPAKSSTPILANNPSGCQVACANGA